MIDTIDSLLYHEITTSERIINFLEKIKEIYPNLLIMINRAFEIINEVPIDAVLLESTISTHDFETKQYILHEKPYEICLKDSIKCYSVDYWHLEDTKMIDKIKNVATNKGYIPLVTDIKLQDLP